MSRFGNFDVFCRDSTLPVCNLFLGAPGKACPLKGLDSVRNLGSVLLSGFAILISTALFLFAEKKKKAAVGRREMQIFLVFFILVSLAEMFSIGGFLKDRNVVVWWTAIHLGAIVATVWVLLLNAIVGYQLLDDGTPLSMSLVAGSALGFLIVTAYVAIDTGFHNPGKIPTEPGTLKNYALYVLYLLFPLLAIVAFFILETVLVLKILEEYLPMIRLGAAALLFVIGQIFNFVISVNLCKGVDGAIDGSLFETLFTLLAVVAVFWFWSGITEDEWPDDPIIPIGSAYP